MRNKPLKGIEEFVSFFMKAFIPHMDNEENTFFPSFQVRTLTRKA
ncbi:MAG: hypothetical protein NDF55_03885 [archaeon GB-1867-005]|nr:hypothetical protein [Candidatus Culexmicrobium cathedralense]